MRRSWQRDSVAWLASLLLHAFLVLFFVQVQLDVSSAPETISEATRVTVERALAPVAKPARVRTPAKPLAARPQRAVNRLSLPSPQPKIVRPRLAFIPSPRPPRPRSARHELAKIVPRASPLASPEPLRTPAPLALATLRPEQPRAALIPPPDNRLRLPSPLPAAAVPTVAPTLVPTIAPTVAPTAAPTAAPTVAPTLKPTAVPTAIPTAQPTAKPTSAPTATATTAPTAAPTTLPTAAPVVARTAAPAPRPTPLPSAAVAAKAAPSPAAAPAAGRAPASPGPRATPAAIERSPAPPFRPPVPIPSPKQASAATSSPAHIAAGEALNARLKALIPHNDVSYSEKRVSGDIAAAIAQMKGEYLAKLWPPPEVLARALFVVKRRRTAAEPDSVMYVLKKRRILGFEICTGWQVVAHPLGGGPAVAGYAFGLCAGSDFTPAWSAELPGTPAP